jgi:hypothetical protein
MIESLQSCTGIPCGINAHKSGFGTLPEVLQTKIIQYIITSGQSLIDEKILSVSKDIRRRTSEVLWRNERIINDIVLKTHGNIDKLPLWNREIIKKVQKSIKRLNLNNGVFSRPGLRTIGKNFSHIEELNLEHATVRKGGIVEIGRFKALRSLSLYGVGPLSGRNFQKLRTLSRLENLNLSYTFIARTSLSTLRHFQKLKSLSLSQITLTKKEMRLLSNLEKLEFSFCQFAPQALELFTQFHNARELIFESCGAIDDTTLGYLQRLPLLNTLELKMGHMSQKGVEKFCAFPALTTLSLTSINLNDEDLSSLQYARKLKKLDLVLCPISGSILKDLKWLPLEELRIGDSDELKAEMLPTLTEFPHLERLAIVQNGFSVQELEFLSKIPNLRELDLSVSDTIGDSIFDLLGNCRKLELVTLSDCSKLTDEAIRLFKKNYPSVRVKAYDRRVEVVN